MKKQSIASFSHWGEPCPRIDLVGSGRNICCTGEGEKKDRDDIKGTTRGALKKYSRENTNPCRFVRLRTSTAGGLDKPRKSGGAQRITKTKEHKVQEKVIACKRTIQEKERLNIEGRGGLWTNNKAKERDLVKKELYRGGGSTKKQGKESRLPYYKEGGVCARHYNPKISS